jgi:hypothetical protein
LLKLPDHIRPNVKCPESLLFFYTLAEQTMKGKFALLIMVLACAASINAQVMLSEGFTAPFTPSTSGWYEQNNSMPLGTGTWFQGNGTVFPAYNGSSSDYYAVNFNSAGSGTQAGISNFLITPTVSLTNGGVLQFATRTITNPAQFPDRLQVLYSIGTGTGAIGAGTTATGTFTGQITTIDSSLTSTGYPASWSVYSATLSGITGTVPGRFAFRYWVDSAGPSGINSNYIGIDNVIYNFPCPAPTIALSQTVGNICSGQTFTTSASGAASYSWAPGGQTTSSISVSPSTTVIYTITGVTANCPATQTIAVNVTASPTVAANNATICSGVTATLHASGASTYSWQPGGQTTSSIAVSPTVNATYTVTGSNGNCQQTQTVSVTLSSSLGVIVSPSQDTICSGQSVTITASGAQSYSWSTGDSTSVIIISPGTSANYIVNGLIPPACTGTSAINITVNPTPTLTVLSSDSIACINTTVTLTGSGAASYTWNFAGGSATVNPASLGTGASSGVLSISLTGQAIGGCTSTAVYSQTVRTCVGLEEESNPNVQVTIYPNPFTTELNLRGFSGNIQIYNALGQVVISALVRENESVSTASLPKGLYTVKACNAEGTIVKIVRVIRN